MLRNEADSRRSGGLNADSSNDEEAARPMRRLVWFETALAFGGLVPLLLPLLALQLHAGSYIFEWHLRRAPSSEPQSSSSSPAVVLPVLRRAMQMHSVVVLSMHSFLVAFFFRDSDLHGATGLS